MGRSRISLEFLGPSRPILSHVGGLALWLESESHLIVGYSIDGQAADSIRWGVDHLVMISIELSSHLDLFHLDHLGSVLYETSRPWVPALLTLSHDISLLLRCHIGS